MHQVFGGQRACWGAGLSRPHWNRARSDFEEHLELTDLRVGVLALSESWRLLRVGTEKSSTFGKMDDRWVGGGEPEGSVMRDPGNLHCAVGQS